MKKVSKKAGKGVDNYNRIGYNKYCQEGRTTKAHRKKEDKTMYNLVLFSGMEENMKIIDCPYRTMDTVDSLVAYVQEIANDYGYDVYTFRACIDHDGYYSEDIVYNRTTKTFSRTVVDGSAFPNIEAMFQRVEMTESETIAYIEQHAKQYTDKHSK